MSKIYYKIYNNCEIILITTTILLTITLVFHFHTTVNKGYLPNDVAGYYIRFLDLAEKNIREVKYPFLIPLIEGLILGYPIDTENITIRYNILTLTLTSISVYLILSAFKISVFEILDSSKKKIYFNNKICFILFIILFTSSVTIYFNEPAIKSFVFGPFSRLLGATSIVLLISTAYINDFNRKNRVEKIALSLGILSHPVAGIFFYLYILIFKLPKSIKSTIISKSRNITYNIIKFLKNNIVFIITIIISTIPYINLIFDVTKIPQNSSKIKLIISLYNFLSLMKPYIININLIIIIIILIIYNIIKIRNKEIKAIKILFLFILYIFIQFYFTYNNKPFTIIQYNIIIIYWFILIQISRFILYNLINNKNNILSYAFLLLLVFQSATYYLHETQKEGYYTSVYSFYGTSTKVIKKFDSILKDLRINRYNYRNNITANNVYIVGTKTRWYIALSILNNYEYFEAYSYSGFLCTTPRPFIDENKNMIKGFISITGNTSLINGYIYTSLVEGNDDVVRSIVFSNLGYYIPQYYMYFASGGKIVKFSYPNSITIIHNSSKLFFNISFYLNNTSLTIKINGYNSYKKPIKIISIIPLFNKQITIKNNTLIEVTHKYWFINKNLSSLILIQENKNINVSSSGKYIKISSTAKSSFHGSIIIKINQYCSNINSLAQFYINLYKSIINQDYSLKCKNGIIVIDSTSHGNIYKYIEKLLIQHKKNIVFLNNISKNINIYIINCK